MSERRGYRIRGTVQGVGFRWWTRKTASDLGLCGTVRNADDGSVEVEVEGEESSMEEFEKRLGSGPPTARVRDVRREEPTEAQLPAGFEIIH